MIISVAGILVIVLLAFVAYKLIKDVTRERSTNNIVNIEENAEIKENWSLGAINKVKGTTVLQVPLSSDQKYSRSYYSKSTNSTRNYLFINTQTSEKYWLFDHANYLIEKRENIRKGGYSSKEPVKATMFHIVKIDSDTDNRLTTSDYITVAFTKSDGKGYFEVLSNVEKFISSELISDNELLMIYQVNNSYFSAIVNLENFSIRDNEPLPSVGNRN